MVPGFSSPPVTEIQNEGSLKSVSSLPLVFLTWMDTTLYLAHDYAMWVKVNSILLLKHAVYIVTSRRLSMYHYDVYDVF